MTGSLLKEFILTDGTWTDDGTQYTVNKQLTHRTGEGKKKLYPFYFLFFIPTDTRIYITLPLRAQAVKKWCL